MLRKWPHADAEADAAANGDGDATNATTLKRTIFYIAVRLARAWSHPSELRLLLSAVVRPGGALSRPMLSLLVAATKPLGPPLPYVSLRPADGAIELDIQERAWPPAQGYTIC